tara:strand:+ start:328 stop:510 length:183 start_codon:yes stop_codon:yes gene_type:complete
MLNTEMIIALSKWISNWKNTYGEIPSINESITWIEWQFNDIKISKNDKDSIQTILLFHKD